MNNKLTLYYITGPIGTGKSTIANFYIPEFVPEGVEYINADLYYFCYFKNNKGTEQENYERAKKYRDYKINKAIHNQQSFVWESVFSEEKISLLQHCKNCGYTLVGLFVGTDNPNVLYKRVKERISDGWYDVPIKKIADRYHVMMNLLSLLYNISETMFIVDSSNEQNKLVCYKYVAGTKYTDASCKWIINYLENNIPIQGKNYKQEDNAHV